MTIKYMMPEWILGIDVYSKFCELRMKNPYAFYPNQEIQFIYGMPPNAIWNGGGCMITNDHFYLLDEIKEMIRHYNEDLHIPIAWTFTNPLLKKTDIYDRYCNLLAEAGHNGQNYIVVNLPFMEKYLKKHYPNYKYCKSILSAEAKKNYKTKNDFIVLEKKKNIDFKFLNSIPIEQRKKIEILANENCMPFCPYAYTHYNDLAEAQLNFEVSDRKKVECHTHRVYEEVNNPFLISKRKIDEVYAPMGYTHFKLGWRGGVEGPICGILDYFTLPEYRQDVLDSLTH